MDSRKKLEQEDKREREPCGSTQGGTGSAEESSCSMWHPDSSNPQNLFPFLNRKPSSQPLCVHSHPLPAQECHSPKTPSLDHIALEVA